MRNIGRKAWLQRLNMHRSRSGATPALWQAAAALPSRASSMLAWGVLEHPLSAAELQTLAHPGAPALLLPGELMVVQPVETGSYAGDLIFWSVLSKQYERVTNSDLAALARRWAADTLAEHHGVTGLQAARLHPETAGVLRLASAALALCTRPRLQAEELTGLADYAVSMREVMPYLPDRIYSLKTALAALKSGALSPLEVEPHGPLLCLSAAWPGAEDAERLKQERDAQSAAFGGLYAALTRGEQGRALPPHQVPLRAAWPKAADALGPEQNLAWAWEHPEVQRVEAQLVRSAQERARRRLANAVNAAANHNRRAEQARMLQKTTTGLTPAEAPARGKAKPASLLMRAAEALSAELRPILLGERGDNPNLAERVERITSAWNGVTAAIPHLRPLMSELRLEIDPVRCARLEIQGGALDVQEKVLYINFGANLEHDELMYVIAELCLHLALGHPARALGKDPGAWAYACDLLLAGWLHDMKFGQRPPFAPYDEELSHLEPVEAIYQRLLQSPALLRRRPSLRSPERSDLLTAGEGQAGMSAEEDEPWRQAIIQGMKEAEALEWAGLMAGGLLRELQERAAEPIAWRPALQQFLGQVVPRRARKRTYARPSRRSTLDIRQPRAARKGDEPGPMHSLVLVVDTSGSVEDRDLEEMLGGVRTTCKVLGIERIRLISCDSEATDHGWHPAWSPGARVELTGMGGTLLRPALDLVERLSREGEVHPLSPMLIYTDGMVWDDLLVPPREHAWLLPKGGRLPWRTQAPIFTVVPR